MKDDILKNLTCTRCKATKETYGELVYSQGSLVCVACKEDLTESDKAAFDRDIEYRIFNNSD